MNKNMVWKRLMGDFEKSVNDIKSSAKIIIGQLKKTISESKAKVTIKKIAESLKELDLGKGLTELIGTLKKSNIEKVEEIKELFESLEIKKAAVKIKELLDSNKETIASLLTEPLKDSNVDEIKKKIIESIRELDVERLLKGLQSSSSALVRKEGSCANCGTSIHIWGGGLLGNKVIISTASAGIAGVVGAVIGTSIGIATGGWGIPATVPLGVGLALIAGGYAHIASEKILDQPLYCKTCNKTIDLAEEGETIEAKKIC